MYHKNYVNNLKRGLKRGSIKRNRPLKPVFKLGGIIAGGVSHDEANLIGDKGIPVVSYNSYMKKGGKYDLKDKTAEVESEEIVFTKETAEKIDKLVDEYENCKCPKKLVALGELIKKALKSTTDETCRTQCKFEPALKSIK